MTAALQIGKAFIERSVVMDGFDVHIVGERQRIGSYVMQPIAEPAYKMVEAGQFIDRHPAFQLDHPSAQALLDALWAGGLRPSGGDLAGATGMAAAMQAMQAHIDDLRVMAQLVQPADRPKLAGAGTF